VPARKCRAAAIPPVAEALRQSTTAGTEEGVLRALYEYAMSRAGEAELFAGGYKPMPTRVCRVRSATPRALAALSAPTPATWTR
jgi:hypothetical protein